MMGSPSNEKDRDSDETQHRVTLSKGFYLQTTEVTQAQWKAVMGSSNPSHFKGDDLPVEQVSWNDAQDFIQKLNAKEGTHVYRLPTEAEWEYACRAGTKTAYYWGSSMDGDYCWYNSNSSSKTHPVAQKRSNDWGLYDMSGNVWEWCSDWRGSYPSGFVTGPQGPSSGPTWVLRGGSWTGFPWYCRSAACLRVDSDHAVNYGGFRIARALK